MVRLFSETDKVFDSNGDAVINPFKARVHKEDNGDFFLDIEADVSYVNEIVSGRILVVPTPQGDQAFRISNPTKTAHKITCRAKHVFYDAENYMIADADIPDSTCNEMLDTLNTSTDTTSPFGVISDIDTSILNNYHFERTSLKDAISVVAELWGGHIIRDNYSVAVRSTIGRDNGVTVRYGKNLKNITCSEDWSKVCTKVLPVGKDNILLNAIDSSQDIYVSAATQYGIPYTKTVSFVQDAVVRDEFETDEDYLTALVSDLQNQAIAYVDSHYAPEVNYTLSANMEEITDVGDVVEVIDERLGVNILTNVISYEYDCILGRYISVSFGNFKPKLSSLTEIVQKNAEDAIELSEQTVRVSLGKELRDAEAAIWGVLGNSYVQYDGDKILVMDEKTLEEARNVMVINSGGIGFSQDHGQSFTSAWTLDGTLNMQNINVINLVADLIKGGTLRLGSVEGDTGVMEIYDAQNNLIGRMDEIGLTMYGEDGSYILMNREIGFAGYDKNGVKTYWVSEDEFHMRKSVVEEEITLCNKVRFIPIATGTNDGIGMVSVLSTGGGE